MKSLKRLHWSILTSYWSNEAKKVQHQSLVFECLCWESCCSKGLWHFLDLTRLPGDQFGTQHDVKPTDADRITMQMAKGTAIVSMALPGPWRLWCGIEQLPNCWVGGTLLSWWPNLNCFTILSGRLASNECGSNSYSQNTGRNCKGA